MGYGKESVVIDCKHMPGIKVTYCVLCGEDAPYEGVYDVLQGTDAPDHVHVPTVVEHTN